ncbi:ATP-binding protein [Streptomyces sp. DSM 44917]|uniref:ATP-binding protein n=1 Tax=Streptomyces boetiae TaxID=3075541 RepID=A0ABU2L6K5_9ACTN|nr:ATP-binding protein [Streptomyces sp. DSM 44917]MDT0307189.1 ATP-binding protein [Streptomyces sp. DSM 44917]
MSEHDEKSAVREVIAKYAMEHFAYFRTPDGTPYAQRIGHPIARPLKSQGVAGSHRQELMLDMFNEGLGLFSGTAMKEALDLIEALTISGSVRQVNIRVAPCQTAVGVTWLDLGRDDGQSVRIAPGGWQVRKPSADEVVWRRTQLTGELPSPQPGQGMAGIDRLWELCNFSDAESSALAIAWLLGCLDPAVPVPAPFLTGPQGAGKSTTARMLTRVIEGMSADLRRAPKDEDGLITAVAAGWVTPLDNLSHLSADMSDLMCCIVTGAETIKRALYTDGDVHRARYRRPLLLTGIDVGVIRPDLGERLLHLKLERPARRRSEAELWAEFSDALPAILGGLLDLAVEVRAQQVDVPADLRMADFARLCAQFDHVHHLGSLPAYRASLDDLTDDVIEGDVLAQTVLRHAATMGQGPARQSSSSWLDTLTRLYSGSAEDAPYRPLPKGWPTTGKVLSDRLKRLQPTLAARGVIVEWGRHSRQEDPARSRYIEITPGRGP